MNFRQMNLLLAMSALTLSVACGDKGDDTAGEGGDEDDTGSTIIPTDDTGETPPPPFQPDSMYIYSDGAVANVDGVAIPSTWNYDGQPQFHLMRVLLVDEDWEGEVNDEDQCLIDFALIDGTYVDMTVQFASAGAWTGWAVDTAEYTEDGSGGGLLGWSEVCNDLDPEFAPSISDVINATTWAIGYGPAWGTTEVSDFESSLRGALDQSGIPWEGDDENVSWENTVLALYAWRSDAEFTEGMPQALNYGFAFEMDSEGNLATDSEDLLQRLGDDDAKVSEWEEMPAGAYFRTYPFYGWRFGG